MSAWTPSADKPRRPSGLVRPPALVDDPRWMELRRPFPDSQVGHKPQPWCRDCVENKRDKHCERHQVIQCRVCGQRITAAHVDLEYIGHAAVTERLNETDPWWEWWPITEDQLRAHNFRRVGDQAMWIWLDILGHIRPGLGEAEGTQLRGANAEKSLISDAIKNAAMRFGVGLQAWSKEELASKAATDAQNADDARVASGEAHPDAGDAGVTPGRDWLSEVQATTDAEALSALAEECKRAGQFQGAALAAFRGRKKQLDKPATKTTAEEPRHSTTGASQ